VKELPEKIASPESSFVTDFDHAKEVKRQARRAAARRIGLAVHVVVVAGYLIAIPILWINYKDVEVVLKSLLVFMGIEAVIGVANSMLELNLGPSATVLTSKVSDLPRLLKKAKSVAELHPTDEYHVAGVWNSLDYLTKHLYPHHRREISDETITHLGDLLSTETLSSRLKTLLLIANICANESLLPSLSALNERSSEIDTPTRRNHPLARGGRHRPADLSNCHNTSNHLAARMHSHDDEY
jgi:hypothetical protein